MTERPMNELSLDDYLAALGGGDPAPGGGSAAALAGALAAASAEMVANFTVGRKKYADVEAEMREHLEAVTALRAELTALVQADVEAYSAVGAAYGMARGSDDEKAAREAAIQEALRGAAEVPLALADCCARLAPHLAPLAAKGNRNLISDVGVAAGLCRAAFDCATLNVEVNLAWMKDAEFALRARMRLDVLREAVHRACDRVWADVMDAVRGE
ncbi:MAG: cyclodeaminase/cyclohydrolase family protein [Armatimonadetes bacterium]|nr:cyclodeaminase/cyclohydrolase family protein [Armatimonadota bacterium]